MSDTLTPREPPFIEKAIELYALIHKVYFTNQDYAGYLLHIKNQYKQGDSAVVYEVNQIVSAIESAVQQEREALLLAIDVQCQKYQSHLTICKSDDHLLSVANAFEGLQAASEWLRSRSTPQVTSGKDKNYYAIKNALDSFWENATPEQIAKLIEVAENECGLHVDPPVTDNKEASL